MKLERGEDTGKCAIFIMVYLFVFGIGKKAISNHWSLPKFVLKKKKKAFSLNNSIAYVS